MNKDVFKSYDIRGKVGTELTVDGCKMTGDASTGSQLAGSCS
jgi:hypothetical protein